MATRKRYPGPVPFEASDRQLFFGRQRDIDRLAQLIQLERMVVLFGKSGMGKTSLLNAGVVPQLKDSNPKLKEMFVRVRRAIPNDPLTLRQIFSQHIEDLPNAFPLLDKLAEELPDQEANSIWTQFKRYQLAHGTDKTYLIVFDQFEEFFTHPTAEIDSFLRELSELFYTTVPQAYRDAILKLSREGTKLTDETVNLLFAPIQVKIVFSLRIENLSEMTRLAPYFPSILSTTHQLNTLQKEEAEAAIIGPAQMSGDFDSPPFAFAPAALDSVFDALFDKERKQIECFQLQIVCEYLASVARQKGARADSMIVFTVVELGDLKKVYEDYYLRQINKLKTEERVLAQLVLEKELLINDQRYLKYSQAIEDETGATPELLEKLVNSNLIRAEVLPGGKYYEISHDQFIPALKKARQAREDDERLQRHLDAQKEARKLEEERTKFENARRLDKIEKEAIKAMRKESTRKTFRFFWERAVRKERANLVRSYLLLGGIVVSVLTILGMGIYFAISERAEDRQFKVWQEQLRQTNDALRQQIEQGNLPAEQTRELLKQYESLQQSTLEKD